MNKRKIISLSALLICLISCSVQRTSRITSDSIKPGMAKDDVVSKLGKPYKEDYHYTKDSVFIDNLYYKENLWLHGDYWVTTILEFKNDVLISTKQTQDVPANSVNSVPEKINRSPIIK